MPTIQVKKVGDNVVAQGKFALTEAAKPLYAVLGANSLALAKSRELPTVAQTQAKVLQDRLAALPQQARTLPKVLPARAEELRDRAEGAATTLAGRVVTTYAELVDRGEHLVSAIRRQPATKQATARVRTAKSQTKAATTSTRKAAAATAKAAQQAADKASE